MPTRGAAQTRGSSDRDRSSRIQARRAYKPDAPSMARVCTGPCYDSRWLQQSAAGRRPRDSGRSSRAQRSPRPPTYPLHRVSIPSIGGPPRLKRCLIGWLLRTVLLPSSTASFSNDHVYVVLERRKGVSTQSAKVPWPRANHGCLMPELLHSDRLRPNLQSRVFPAYRIVRFAQPRSASPELPRGPRSPFDSHQGPPSFVIREDLGAPRIHVRPDACQLAQ